ncbi:MAG TPA: cytochrome c-type biogenesis protein CcmH [Acidimicrobiales bacterium]|nr:cytochrome c-type biogenesis protein CcmH [Acidimicrobiales bacterium]
MTAAHVVDRAPARARVRTVGAAGALVARRAGFVAMLVVLGVALVIGSGAVGTGHPSATERAAAIESRIRCPSCEDLSVAQSQAATAVAVRHRITAMIRRGATDAQIEQALVARYGPSILLAPPASGIGVLVYVVPALAGAAALVGVGVLFVRRSRAMARLRAGP